MKVPFIVMSCSVIVSICGCVLPAPSRSTIALGLRGRIVANSTSTPISGVRVEEVIAPDMIQHVVTAEDGSFEIDPVQQRHWGRSVGLALTHPLPHQKRFLGEPVPLRLSHPGYQSRELLILTPDWPQPTESKPVPHRAVAVTNQYLELGIIELDPKE